MEKLTKYLEKAWELFFIILNEDFRVITSSVLPNPIDIIFFHLIGTHTHIFNQL